MVFKSKYLKILTIVLASLLGFVTTMRAYALYDWYDYKHGVLIIRNRVYNKFGREILWSGNGFFLMQTSDGTPILVSNQYGGYDVYTLKGVCIAKNVSLDDIM